MHMHNHCEHELKYCNHCDVVYCEKCGKEWGTQRFIWYYCGMPYYVTWNPNGYTITTTTGVTVSSPDVLSSFKCSHVSETNSANTAVCTHISK